MQPQPGPAAHAAPPVKMAREMNSRRRRRRRRLFRRQRARSPNAGEHAARRRRGRRGAYGVAARVGAGAAAFARCPLPERLAQGAYRRGGLGMLQRALRAREARRREGDAAGDARDGGGGPPARGRPGAGPRLRRQLARGQGDQRQLWHRRGPNDHRARRHRQPAHGRRPVAQEGRLARRAHRGCKRHPLDHRRGKGGGQSTWQGGKSPDARGKPPAGDGAEGKRPAGRDAEGAAQPAHSDSAQTAPAPR